MGVAAPRGAQRVLLGVALDEDVLDAALLGLRVGAEVEQHAEAARRVARGPCHCTGARPVADPAACRERPREPIAGARGKRRRPEDFLSARPDS